MADFNKAIPRILAYEGGYVNDPDDPGGETKYGIIDRLDGVTDGKVDVDGDTIPDVTVKDLTIDQAKQIYKRKFWDKMKGDAIQSQAIAEILFDGYVNTGKTALKQIQRVIGVFDDGVIGPETLEKLNFANEARVFNRFKAIRVQYYKDLAERKPVLKKFLKGWLNRINSFKNL